MVDLDGPLRIDGTLVLNDGGSTTLAPGGYVEVTRPNSLGGYDSGYVDVQPDGTFTLQGLHTGDVCTITVVPPGAGTIVIDSGDPTSTNEIRLSLGEPGPSPLISDVHPEIEITPVPATIGKDNLRTKVVVRNVGPHLSTGTTVRVHHGDTNAYRFAASEYGGYNTTSGETTWTVSYLPPGCGTTGRVWTVPVETGRYEYVVSLWHAGYDPDGSNNVGRLTVEHERGADDDGDDIINWYELEVTGTTTGLVAGTDGDRDGILNSDEWILRWDPTVSNAPFRLTGIEPGESGGASALIPTETGRVYTLYRSLDIMGNPVWTPLVARGGTGGLLPMRDPQSATQAWYRAGVRAP